VITNLPDDAVDPFFEFQGVYCGSGDVDVNGDGDRYFRSSPSMAIYAQLPQFAMS